jgi:hypothetical protein
MDKTENQKKEEADRRQDFGRRLRIAVRRAHDPVFAPLKPPVLSAPPGHQRFEDVNQGV